MPDKPFVINDRRKFTAEGEFRPEAATPATEAEPASGEPGRSGNEPAAHAGKPHKEPIAFPASTSSVTAPEPGRSEDEPDAEDEDRFAARTHETISFPSSAREDVPPASGDDDLDDSAEAEEGALPPLTAEQIDQAERAYNATVDRLDTALRANNLGSEPLPEMTFDRLVQSLYMQALIQLGGAAEPGQPPQVDLLGARQTIDMLALIGQRSAGNLSNKEDQFLQSALFEIRMGFLEVTQALARQATSRQPTGGAPSGIKGPGIVR